jgi:inorganic pyrophosphatase
MSMANINHKPSKYMLNLLHVLPPFADEEKKIVNVIVEITAGSINKYELITETGTLKLDRVWYSSLAYPFTYWAIPSTWDLDNDMLDVVIANVTEPLIPWSLVEIRIIGVIKFVDGGEIDDKIIAVINDDKRQDHITSYEQLWPHWQKEAEHYLEYYKHLKKPWTWKVEWFFWADEAMRVIKECAERYEKEYAPKFLD